jgi:hypothetical protein
MKTNRVTTALPKVLQHVTIALVIGLVLATTAVGMAHAQIEPDVEKFVIAGGGGSSTSQRFTLIGTIGQTDVGTTQGGRFTLTGGFWTAQPAQGGGVEIEERLFIPIVQH